MTGGAGFIGSHYVRTLLSGGYPGYEDAQVTVYDKLTYAGNLANLDPVRGQPRYTFVQGDICDPAKLRGGAPRPRRGDQLRRRVARRPVDRGRGRVRHVERGRRAGAARRLPRRPASPRIVHVSTDEVYGSIAEGAWTEQSPLDPNSPYSAAKAGGDLIAIAYARTHGVNVSITRCCNNYGPYQYPEKVIPLFATNLLDGKPVPLYGDGLNVRGWIHVDDHCRGIQLVLERGERGQGLQHQRRRRAVQPRADRGHPRQARRVLGRRGAGRPTARATTAATASTTRCSARWATPR